MSCTVYILFSKKSGRYYIGSAGNVIERLKYHNGPRARWTKRFQPWILVHAEELKNRGDALRREKFLKNLKGIGSHLEDVKKGLT